MNYRHAFHAGNFADVFKHALLSRMLLYLVRKDAPLRYIDTHAGRGLYDLDDEAAQRTQEWRGGIGRLVADQPDSEGGSLPGQEGMDRDGGAQELGSRLRGNERSESIQGDPTALFLLAPYLALVGPRGLENRPARYPGSPVIAQRLLRPADRLALNELHPQDAQALARTLGSDARVKITSLDAYVALNAFVPPRERRGLVLIDPAFEAEDEFARALGALAKAHRKWPTGVYALWYPIKDQAEADAFASTMATSGIARALRLELLVERGPKRGRHDTPALVGCGLVVINPPFALQEEAEVILTFLAQVLANDGSGNWRVEWLAKE
ncbi:MAG: 23S rRNA (adenine(2030)-N(6))-methyltransferase RlmJ [Methylobacteriaceae bacterium]|nr:23S rRNA (adenine(2030)-N(6))-methyltransferase RlmJ [Methylobacteriaceae bacterium]